MVYVSLESEVFVIFGVLIINLIEEVIERVGIKVGNKGVDVVMIVIEMINLIKGI